MAFLPGFDDRWRDPADFILGITRDIWEDRRIRTLKDYYGEDLIVRSPASVIKGNAGIIAATEATLAEFPDRQLFGEDVIWTRTGRDHFLSSHRLLCTATHTGPGMYGAPTGRRLAYRIIADCWCRANGVRDEWLIRDQGAIVRQMGREPRSWTQGLIRREGGPENCVRPLTPETDLDGPYRGSGNDSEVGSGLALCLEQIMEADLSAIPAHYDRAAELFYPGHVTDHGHAGADRFWLNLRSAFPSATFRIDHGMGAADHMIAPRAAIRWSLHGRHDGWGMFGRPTGAEVYVMGMTHAEFGPQGIRREWTLIDETAIWKQILLETGEF